MNKALGAGPKGLAVTADCSDDGLSAALCRPPSLTARIVSHLLVAECMPSCVHRATRFNTIATRCRRRIRVPRGVGRGVCNVELPRKSLLSNSINNPRHVVPKTIQRVEKLLRALFSV